MVKIDLKGQIKEFEQGVTAADVAKSIGMGLYKSACAAKIDGQVCDLRTPIERDCSLEILTFDTAEGKHAYWHTTSHIMAQAVMRLYPGTKFSIGPAIENGFYYDFDLEQPLSTEDLPAIEEEMKKIIKENLPLERFELPPEEAEKLMADQPYKEELIAEHAGKGENISFYKQGDFTDLCAGPHLMSTGMVKAVKLTAITGAYWRGDAKNKMLTRVYGIAFPKQSMLEEHLQMLEEAKKRDHRRLGKELGLFMLRDEGPGFPFFLPKGMVLKNLLIDYWREVHKKYGYVEVSTPIILSRKLWERSGHWDHYKDNMYTTVIDEEDYAIKPMNCPGGMMVYQSQPHSYRDLPLRVGELGLVHRHELSGALHGLFRVRCFTQDDAHLFMTPDQLKDELKNVVRLFDEVYSVFGLSYKIELSTMPEDHIGTVEQWEHNQEILKEAITEPHLAVRHGAAGQPAARALRAGVRGRGRPEAPPRHAAPCGAGLHRAVHRCHHRALRGQVPPVAQPCAGGGVAHFRAPSRVRPGCAGRAGGSRLPGGVRPAQRKDWLQDSGGPAAAHALHDCCGR